MEQMELFPREIKREEIKTLEGINEVDQTWLHGFDADERPAAYAFLKWKKAEGMKTFDKLSRPQLWMEGFQLGRDMAEHYSQNQGTAEA